MLLLSHHRTLTPKFHEPGKNESDLMFYVTLWALSYFRGGIPQFLAANNVIPPIFDSS